MKTKFLRSVRHLPLLNARLLLIAMATGASAQTLVWQENWESPAAQEDWYADNGVWEIGQPTSGPGAAQGGVNCAATVLAGDYADDRQSRLVSSPILVPVAELNPRLRFWHWWSVSENDFGQVQISTDNAVSWQPLSSKYGEDGVANICDSSGRWSRAWLYLGGYAGQTMPLGFYLESNTTPVVGVTVSSRWYVDDLVIETGPEPSLELPEGFEGGWGGWKTQYGGGRQFCSVSPCMATPGQTHSGHLENANPYS